MSFLLSTVSAQQKEKPACGRIPPSPPPGLFIVKFLRSLKDSWWSHLKQKELRGHPETFRGSRPQNCYRDEPENSKLSGCDIRPFQRNIFPFKKPGNQPLYIDTQSNYPPSIIKHLPAAISRRISDISCNQGTFDEAKPDHEKALEDSGYTEELLYDKTPDNEDLNKSKKNKRKRNIIWFNLPYRKNVQTNVGKIFLRLIKKPFPKKKQIL